MTPDECAAELARLFGAQTEICREILKKSQRQRELVAAGGGEDELLSLLGDKQKLIDRQGRLAGEARVCRDLWEESARLNSSPEARAGVEAAWNTLRDTLDRIVKLEDESRAKLQELKSRVSVDIGNLQRGKIVNQAYGGGKFKPPAPARYSDRRG